MSVNTNSYIQDSTTPASRSAPSFGAGMLIMDPLSVTPIDEPKKFPWAAVLAIAAAIGAYLYLKDK